jgi:hypothetical protein
MTIEDETTKKPNPTTSPSLARQAIKSVHGVRFWYPEQRTQSGMTLKIVKAKA